MEHTQTDHTPLTHQIRRGFLNPIYSRIRALQAAMIQVIKERITEWKVAGMGSRIGIESQIILSSDDYDTFTIIAVDLNKDGNPIAIVEEDMGSNVTNSGLEYLSLDLLAQIIDDLRIEIPVTVLPRSEQGTEYQPLLKAYEAARQTADALKQELLAEIGKTHDVFALDIAEPPSDEDLERIYPADEVDHAICYKDNHDNICCFEEFSSRLGQQGYSALLSDGRVDYYIRPR